jgi:hypothetical protein
MAVAAVLVALSGVACSSQETVTGCTDTPSGRACGQFSKDDPALCMNALKAPCVEEQPQPTLQGERWVCPNGRSAPVRYIESQSSDLRLPEPPPPGLCVR